MSKQDTNASIEPRDLPGQDLSNTQNDLKDAGVTAGISKKGFRKRFRDILFVITVLFLVAVLLSVMSARAHGKTPEVFGYRIYVVQSSSMSPTLKVGSMFIAKHPADPQNLNVDDIITFESDSHQTVTHRIIEVVLTDSGVMYRTQGDNNNVPDPDLVAPEKVSAVFVIAVPLT